MILDIGGGKSKGNDIKTIDITPGADIIHDLDSFPYPIEDDEFEEIRIFIPWNIFLIR